VEALEYEAYEPMADAMIGRLIEEARRLWSLTEAEVRHRMGVVPVGEVSVLVRVKASHRDQAFAACRFLIDRIKEEVPIWKKAIFHEGRSYSMRPYIVAIVGPSGSGKTWLIERLVPLLQKRGLKVGTVKHAHHRIDLDRPGKDSWRHLEAGAEAAAVVGPEQLMMMRAVVNGSALDKALDSLPEELDLILLEGFHKADYPQIAVVGKRGSHASGGTFLGRGRLRHGRHLLAIVSGQPVRSALAQFRPAQIEELAAWMEEKWTRHWETSFCPTSQGSSSAEA